MMEQLAQMNVLLEHNFRFKESIGKYVSVKTVDSEEHEGWLHCIDPVSGNLVLITVDDDCSKMTGVKLLMGGACTELQALREPDEKINGFFEVMAKEQEEKDILDKKAQLIAWVKKNRLPVIEMEDGSLVVGESTTIFPPYDVDNCASKTPRLLRSIRKLVATKPNDVRELLPHYKIE